ncbi:hypothetical protein RFI_32588, partial [Reticulomyxa filosa]
MPQNRTSAARASAVTAGSDLPDLFPPEITLKDSTKRARRVSLPAQAGKIDLGASEEFSEISSGDRLKIARRIEDTLVQEGFVIKKKIKKGTSKRKNWCDIEDRFELGDILDYLNSGMDVVVEDDFSLCFQRKELRPWNWNFYLFIFWCIGVVIRYGILLPVRAVIMVTGILFECFLLWLFQYIFKNKNEKIKEAWE